MAGVQSWLRKASHALREMLALESRFCDTHALEPK